MAQDHQQRLQFASPAWIARIKEILAALVAEHRDRLAEADFTLSETFTAVPPDGTTTHWAARIRAGEVSFADNSGDADFELVADQAAALPGARLIYAGASQADLDAAAAHRDAMIAAGRMTRKGDMAKAGKPVLRVLRDLHDTMARETA
ncbi:MAG: hypothetical protein QM688_12255 [Sphingomonas bacterium]